MVRSKCNSLKNSPHIQVTVLRPGEKSLESRADTQHANFTFVFTLSSLMPNDSLRNKSNTSAMHLIGRAEEASQYSECIHVTWIGRSFWRQHNDSDYSGLCLVTTRPQRAAIQCPECSPLHNAFSSIVQHEIITGSRLNSCRRYRNAVCFTGLSSGETSIIQANRKSSLLGLRTQGVFGGGLDLNTLLTLLSNEADNCLSLCFPFDYEELAVDFVWCAIKYL